VSFSAWVWQIARNRYSHWADDKRKRRESDSGADISELELADEKMSVEDEFVQNEDLALMRRELAFVASDYREIIVAYYIEDRSVRDIAASLKLPEGTVKSKLFRARETLKEGMNMAREFGAMSYRPESVVYSKWGKFGRFNEPECFINRLLCNNIMLAAYRNPSTAEELAVEVGVALPYMEDELKQLVDATLLRKNGKKYETNFYIMSANAQDRMNIHIRGMAPTMADVAIELAECFIRFSEENGSKWHEGYQPVEDIKWALLMHIASEISNGIPQPKYENMEGNKSKTGKHGWTIRPNGGEWDMLGYEEYSGEEYCGVGLHTCLDLPAEYTDVKWGMYKYNYKRIAWKTLNRLNYAELKILIHLVKKGSAWVNDADENTLKILKRLEDNGFVVRTEEGFRPAFWVSLRENVKPFTEAQQAEMKSLYGRLQELAERYFQFCNKVVQEELPEFLKNDAYIIGFAAYGIASSTIKGAILEEALNKGYISYAENDERKMLGVFLEL